MDQNELRTYQRRNVTRESGYHTCEETTGGECIILKAQKTRIKAGEEIFLFCRDFIEIPELFEKKYGLLSFGGYIYSDKNIKVSYRLRYTQGNNNVDEIINPNQIIKENDWNNIGFHKEIPLEDGCIIKKVKVSLIIEAETDTTLEFISFDLDAVRKEEFYDETFDVSFHQKTNMHIPYLYYLNTEYRIEEYLKTNQSFSDGRYVVLKSCNRCGRFLPINIYNELSTLSFSLHCKKKAPCTHSTFRSYQIMNDCDIEKVKATGIKIEDNKVISYYGHQLECKACKKFFVNMPLNPQRNAQQFKEDGLRRRAIEVLINYLLNTNLIHFEFEKRTKKEFSEYIWNKFDHKCFKCKKELTLDEMNLDHTMPLAFLYRLDETATCLCASHNSQKSDHFPIDYYTESELIELSKITGLPLEVLKTKEVNKEVLNLLVKNVVWYFDEFLMIPDYQKVRDGILTADKINDSLKRVIRGKVDLAEEYKKITGHYPTSVTII